MKRKGLTIKHVVETASIQCVNDDVFDVKKLMDDLNSKQITHAVLWCALIEKYLECKNTKAYELMAQMTETYSEDPTYNNWMKREGILDPYIKKTDLVICAINPNNIIEQVIDGERRLIAKGFKVPVSEHSRRRNIPSGSQKPNPPSNLNVKAVHQIQQDNQKANAKADDELVVRLAEKLNSINDWSQLKVGCVATLWAGMKTNRPKRPKEKSEKQSNNLVNANPDQLFHEICKYNDKSETPIARTPRTFKKKTQTGKWQFLDSAHPKVQEFLGLWDREATADKTYYTNSNFNEDMKIAGLVADGEVGWKINKRSKKLCDAPSGSTNTEIKGDEMKTYKIFHGNCNKAYHASPTLVAKWLVNESNIPRDIIEAKIRDYRIVG